MESIAVSFNGNSGGYFEHRGILVGLDDYMLLHTDPGVNPDEFAEVDSGTNPSLSNIPWDSQVSKDEDVDSESDSNDSSHSIPLLWDVKRQHLLHEKPGTRYIFITMKKVNPLV